MNIFWFSLLVLATSLALLFIGALFLFWLVFGSWNNEEEEYWEKWEKWEK